MTLSEEDKELIMKSVKELGSDLIKSATMIISKGVSSGSVNGAQGLLFTMLYADLLHGGAYRWGDDVDRLPFYNADVQSNLHFAQEASFWLPFATQSLNVTIPAGYAGAGKQVALPLGASTLQAEVMLDNFVPHILPKLLSDQRYIEIEERCGQLLNTVLLQGIGTGVKTFLEGPTELLGSITGSRRESRLSAAAAQEAADNTA